MGLSFDLFYNLIALSDPHLAHVNIQSMFFVIVGDMVKFISVSLVDVFCVFEFLFFNGYGFIDLTAYVLNLLLVFL